MQGNGPIEPSADARALARAVFDQYLALTQEGFSEGQALRIVGEMIRGVSGGGAA